MFNFTDLAYIRNGTDISFLNLKNNLYLTLDKSRAQFKMDGIHSFLSNDEFQSYLPLVSKFTIVLSAMPNYKLNKERSPIKFGDQVSFMTANNLFLVSTNNGELRLEELKGDKTLTSMNLPMNSKFTIIEPTNKLPMAKPLFYNDLIVLKSSFGGYLSLTTGNISNNKELFQGSKISKSQNLEKNDNAFESTECTNVNIITNNMMIMDESIFKVIKPDEPFIPEWVNKRKDINFNINSYLYHLDKAFNNNNLENSLALSNTHNLNDNNISNNQNTYSKTMTSPTDKNKPSLSTFSPEEQDHLLLEDILLAMIGKEGKYIKRVVTNTSFQDFKVEFEIEPYLPNPTCDPPLLSITNLLLPMGFYYNSITHFINVSNHVQTGLIVMGFCEGLNKILQEYILFAAQLKLQTSNNSNPNESKTNGLNLQQLWWLCQPSLKILERIHKLCQKCLMIKGGALLNIIYNSYVHESDQKIKSMYKFLLNRSVIPFLSMLQSWVCRGELSKNDYNEFMVCSPKSYLKDQLKDYYFEIFWDLKYKLNKINVPVFMNNIDNKILFIGKTQNIIKECGFNIKCPYEEEFNDFMVIENNKSDSNNYVSGANFFNANSNFNANIKKTLFEPERQILFEKLIDKIYIWTNQTLKRILYKNMNFKTTLESFKKFFLCECGDFYNELINMDNDLFLLDKKQVNKEKLQSYIDDAISITSANKYFNKDLFEFVLTGMAVEMDAKFLAQYNEIINNNEIDVYKAVEKLNEYNERKNNNIGDMKIWECFSLEPKIKWPLNLIFSKSNVLKYQLIFRQLIRLKFTEKNLLNVFVIQKKFKVYELPNYLKESYFLRDCMLNFIKNLNYYMFNEVIESNYLELKNNLKTSKNMEEVINYQETFLNKVLKEGLLNNEEILSNLHAILQCCFIFSRLISKFYDNAINIQKDYYHYAMTNDYNTYSLNEFEIKRNKLREKSDAIQKAFDTNKKKFLDVVNKLSISFETRLKSFLEHLEKIGNEIDVGQKFANLLAKIDFNDYYHSKLFGNHFKNNY